MDALETWTRSEHTADVNGTPTPHPVWRKGTGPGVVVVHEMPGLTTGVITFAEELVAAGHTVLLPHLFGPAGRPFGAGDVLRTMFITGAGGARASIRLQVRPRRCGETTGRERRR